MSDILFIHPNFPAQYRLLAQALARGGEHRVFALGDASWMQAVAFEDITLWQYEASADDQPEGAPPELRGAATERMPKVIPKVVPKVVSEVAPEVTPEAVTEVTPTTAPDYTFEGASALAADRGRVHPYLRGFDAGVRRGQAAIRFLIQKKHQGFEPDVIYVHPGWGDGLFLKDVFPNAFVVGYLEYFYSARGADVGFDAEFPLAFDDIFRVRMLNSLQHHALDSIDLGLCPTEWQKSRYPQAYHSKIAVLHDGIDTERLAPNPQASLPVPECRYRVNGLSAVSPAMTLTCADRVLTYVSRSLEPYRGAHTLIRALPEILAQAPELRVVLVGKFEHSYGPPCTRDDSWFSYYLKEVSGKLTEQMLSRVYCLGWVDYETYIRVLQISRAHVYFTVPFILSWSVLEALSVGCAVIGSDTPPVREIITEGVNARVSPFHDPQALAACALEVLNDPDHCKALRAAARAGVIARYDFRSVVLPRHLALLKQHSPGLSI